jgi:diguanylate cyclase (GGDEF)-like protein
MLDIDNFKAVNDRLGHQAGDRILADVARLLRDGLGADGTVGRWGGEEFILVCPGDDEAAAAARAETLRQTLAAHRFADVGRTTASFGVAAWRPGDRVEDIVGRADAALYGAKRDGRNRVRTSEEPPRVDARRAEAAA